jgi:hydroxymethylbilane synthase
LARAQATIVSEALEGAGAAVEIVVVTTSGDVRAPDTAWGEGAFVDALERALRSGSVDAAVHSAKDVPTDRESDPDLVIAAYLERADARDAVVIRGHHRAASIESIPVAARVGTDSPRRAGFLLALRPDLRVHPLSGNVDTRLRRLDAGETDVLVLAVAGLERLGRGERVGLALDPSLMPPAPGQGALAIQVRANDPATRGIADSLDVGAVRAAVDAERAVLRRLGGGCHAPIGAFATNEDGWLDMTAGCVEPDGGGRRIGTWAGPVSESASLVAGVAEALA